MLRRSSAPPDAILHIGTEKTGTTAIQAMLQEGRAALAPLGFAYPRTPGEVSHAALAVYAAPDNMPGLAPPGLDGGPFDPEAFTAALAAEVRDMPDTVHTVILSSEFCQSRLVTQGQVARLHALLAPMFRRITVLVYLRRQDEMAVSALTSAVASGHAVMDLMSLLPAEGAAGQDLVARVLARYFDHEALLDRWAAVFGAAALRPVLYRADRLTGGDVVLDFLHRCGLPAEVAPPPEARRRNVALGGPALAFLVQLNHRLAEAGLPEAEAADIRSRCLPLLAEAGAGPPLRPTRARAEAFYSRFRAGNERVRARWFPEETTLFPEDFSDYPEEDKVAGPEALEGAIDVAVRLVARLARAA